MTEMELREMLPPAKLLLEYMAANDYKDASGQYPKWYVGLTEHPDLRREEHGSPVLWHSEETASFEVAKKIKEFLYEHFTLMSEDHGGVDASKFVYVFRMGASTRPTLEEANGFQATRRVNKKLAEHTKASGY